MQYLNFKIYKNNNFIKQLPNKNGGIISILGENDDNVVYIRFEIYYINDVCEFIQITTGIGGIMVVYDLDIDLELLKNLLNCKGKFTDVLYFI